MRPLLASSRAFGTVLFALAATPACSSSGSSTTGGSTAKPPSADPAKTLESMSASEATTYCKEAMAYQAGKLSEDELKRAGCAIAGAFGAFTAKTDAEAQQQCQTAYDQCLAKPATSSDAGAAEDPCATFATDAATCKGLTVAEFNACQDEQVAQFKTLADPKVCSTLKAGGGGTTASTPKCDVVKTKCPKLLGDSSSGG